MLSVFQYTGYFSTRKECKRYFQVQSQKILVTRGEFGKNEMATSFFNPADFLPKKRGGEA
jgi:hypothetical protein